MYYLKFQKNITAATRNFTALLVFAISIFTFQSDAFAGAKTKEQALEVDAVSLREMGFSEQEAGNLDAALAAYLQALRIDPTQANVINDVGVIYEEMGLLNQAEQQYLQAIEADPHYLPPLMNLAFLYERKGDTAKTIEYFQKRIDLGDPDDVWTLRAKQELNEIYARFPDIKKHRVIEQKALLVAQLEEEARQKAAAELKANLSKAERYYQEGLTLHKEKKYEDAIKQFDLALGIVPGNFRYADSRRAAWREMVKEKTRQQVEEAFQLLDADETAAAKEALGKILTFIPEDSETFPKK